jgi:diacylglycerol O-acyltransferase
VVTNVPGPQLPLYVLGRELLGLYPMVPLAENTALGIAIMSYNGRLGFGLTGDYDSMGDLDVLAGELSAAIAELVAAARGPGRSPPAGKRARLRAVRPVQ